MSDEEAGFEVVRGYDEERADDAATAAAAGGGAMHGTGPGEPHANKAPEQQQQQQQQQLQQLQQQEPANAAAAPPRGQPAAMLARAVAAAKEAMPDDAVKTAQEIAVKVQKKLASMGDLAKLAELINAGKRPQGSSGNLLWLDDPTPQAPEHWQVTVQGLYAGDALLAIAAWKTGARVLALTMAARLSAHAFMGHRQVVERNGKPGEGGLAFGIWAAISTLQRLLLRIARRFHNRTILHLLALVLGHAQLLAWAIANPQSVLGHALRALCMTARSLYVEAARLARLEGTPALSSRSFPTKAGRIDARWLGRALGMNVSHVSVRPLVLADAESAAASAATDAGGDAPSQCELVRASLQYANATGGEAPARPQSVVIKLPSTKFITKLGLRFESAAQREVYFYTSVAPRMAAANASLPMAEAPHAYLANFDEVSSEFCLVLEDAGSLRAGNVTEGASWQQACSVATRYARFHALHWRTSMEEVDRDFALGWHTSYDFALTLHPALVSHSMRKALSQAMETLQMSGSTVRAPLQRALRSFVDHLPLMLDELVKGPVTFIHAGCRAENLLFPDVGSSFREDRSYRAGLQFDDVYDRLGLRWLSVDWQTSCKGKGVYDLAFFVGLNLEVAEDSGDSCDRTLVSEYYKTLVEAIGDKKQLGGYAAEDCWRDYRLAMLLVALAGLRRTPRSKLSEEDDPAGLADRSCAFRRALEAIERTNAAGVLDEILARSAKPRTMNGVLTAYRHVEDKMLERDRDGIALPGDRPADAPVVVRSATPQDEPLGHLSAAHLKSLTPGPAAPPGAGRRDAYDRWFLNGYHPEGKCFFAAALGFYPGRGVLDAAFSVVVDGQQHNVRVSRHTYAHTKSNGAQGRVVVKSDAGPICITILEPLRRAKLEVQIPGTLVASLTMRGRYEPTMEPPYVNKVRGIGEFHYERFTQLVEWDGSILVKGARNLSVKNWWGTRDRSWGRRPHPEADRGALLTTRRNALLDNRLARHALNVALRPIAHKLPQFYWFWAPINVPNGGFTYHSQQEQDGTVENGAAHIFGDPFGPEHAPYGKVEAAGHSIEYQTSGTRHFRTCTVVMTLQDGRRVTVEFEPVQPFFMSGVGYGHDSMPHGARHEPELVMRSDSFATELADRNCVLNMHVQEISRVRCELHARDAGPKDAPLAVAHGVSGAEQLVVGPHKPSGFTSALDV